MLNYHKPYFDWMNLALDGEIDPDQRAQLDAHLTECLECVSLWDALRATNDLFTAPPVAAPRAGFTGRFKARRAQQRTQPRLMWGALALGFSSLGAAALVMPFCFRLLVSTLNVTQQPAASAALLSGLNALTHFTGTVGGALFITVQTLAAAAPPLLWLTPLLAVGLVVAWALAVRKLIVGAPVR